MRVIDIVNIAGVATKAVLTSHRNQTSLSIPRVSSKRKKKDAEYLKLRERYLTDNFLCKVKDRWL